MFGQQIETWQPFFSTVALAASGLMGLIFLSLSLKLDVIRKPANVGVRQIAWQTFVNFFFLIMFSFVFLVPEQTKLGIALPLYIISSVAISITVARAMRSITSGIPFLKSIQEFVPSLIAYIGMVIIVSFVLADYIQSLIWLLPVVTVLLAVAVRNAWELLVVEHTKTG